MCERIAALAKLPVSIDAHICVYTQLLIGQSCSEIDQHPNVHLVTICGWHVMGVVCILCKAYDIQRVLVYVMQWLFNTTEVLRELSFRKSERTGL